jgi:hypothetical protein
MSAMQGGGMGRVDAAAFRINETKHCVMLIRHSWEQNNRSSK